MIVPWCEQSFTALKIIEILLVIVYSLVNMFFIFGMKIEK